MSWPPGGNGKNYFLFQKTNPRFRRQIIICFVIEVQYNNNNAPTRVKNLQMSKIVCTKTAYCLYSIFKHRFFASSRNTRVPTLSII